MSIYQETTLENGLTIASENMSAVESVSVGVYVRTGSRIENETNNGVAHFLEHMAFKGTKNRSAEDIAREIENVGGNINAYTSRETTAYHLKVLKEDLPLAIDILADILQNSTLEEEEIEKVRLVILQELGQTLDSPDEMVFENLQSETYKNHPMGRSILGSEKSVKNISRDDLKSFMQQTYNAENMVLSAVGNLNHEELVALAKKYFTNLNEKSNNEYTTPKYTPSKIIKEKELEQVHVVMSYEAMSVKHEKYYAANIWNAILGGGMASRLFQEIREKRGLAYTIYSYISNYSDCGTFGIYAATSKDKVKELIDVTKKEIEKSINNISEEEINRAKAQLIASVRMAQESTDSRMGRLARNLFIYKRFVPLSEIIEQVNAVNVDEVKQAAKFISKEETLSISVLGPKSNI